MASSSSKKTARERQAAARAAQQAAERRSRLIRWSAVGGTIVIVIVAIVVIAVTSHGGSSKSPSPSPTPTAGALGPEGIPLENGTILASESGAATGQTIDGIKCESDEQVAYHIHAHLSVYVDGQLRPIPIGIGIVKPDIQTSPQGGFASATQCYYWLHVHAQDGVIHIESPTQTTYTLGQFFDEWRQPLSTQQVATSKGAVTAYLNGKPYTGDPRNIPLTAHAVIQLDLGSPTVAPKPVNWTTSQL